MRRVLSLASAVSVASNVAARTMFVFSQQSKILQDNQKKLNSDSNVWVEDWEVKSLKLNVLKDTPTTVAIEKTLELFNFNDLENPPEAMEMPVHTSFVSSKPYGRKLQLELSDVAMKKGFHSKYWIPVGKVRREQLTLRLGARPTVVMSGGTVKLYHVSQLENCEQVARTPVSGGSRRPYHPSSVQYQVLAEATALNNFATGLYFTKRQAETLKLTIAANVTPLAVEIPSDSRGGLMYYNLDQLELPQAALESLNRTEPDVPSFLLSGEPVRNKENLPKNFKSNFWLSARDAQMYQFNIKPEEEKNGTVLASRTNTLEMFHAEQMVDPDEAYRVAGHYTS
jgi:hypothetical protein